MRKLGVAFILWFLASSAFAGDGNILRARGKPIPGRYIVQIAPGHEVRATVSELALGQAARVLHRYEHALRGAAFEMNEYQAQAMARHPKVVLVEEDVEIWPVGAQTNPPSWGLDRVDQRNLPLGASYTWDSDGTGVNVYVVDSGIRFTHTEFGGRAFPGIDVIGDGHRECLFPSSWTAWSGSPSNATATGGGWTRGSRSFSRASETLPQNLTHIAVIHFAGLSSPSGESQLRECQKRPHERAGLSLAVRQRCAATKEKRHEP